MSFTEDFATAYSKKYAEFDSFWKQNEQRLRDIQKFEGLKGVTYDFLNASHAQAASLADAQAEIARLRGALEVCRGYAIEFPDSLLRDNLLDVAAEALK